jgi:hypothetical protein
MKIDYQAAASIDSLSRANNVRPYIGGKHVTP